MKHFCSVEYIVRNRRSYDFKYEERPRQPQQATLRRVREGPLRRRPEKYVTSFRVYCKKDKPIKKSQHQTRQEVSSSLIA